MLKLLLQHTLLDVAISTLYNTVHDNLVPEPEPMTKVVSIFGTDHTVTVQRHATSPQLFVAILEQRNNTRSFS